MFSRIIGKIVFWLVLVAVVAALWNFQPARDALATVNGTPASWIGAKAPFGSQTVAMMMAHAVLFFVEVTIVAAIMMHLLRRLVGGTGTFLNVVGVTDLVQGVLVIAGIASNVAFGLHAQTILSGAVSAGSIVLLPARYPKMLDFELGVQLGIVAGLFALSRGLAFVALPHVARAWALAEVVTSAYVVTVVVTAAFQHYVLGTYLWSTYRIATLWVFGPVTVLSAIGVVLGLHLVHLGRIEARERRAAGEHQHQGAAAH